MGLFWQVLGYGWAGLLRKYVVEPAHMWWPGTLVQIALFRRVFKPPFFFFLLLQRSYYYYYYYYYYY